MNVKLNTLFISLALLFFTGFSNKDCQIASSQALEDFRLGNYIFYSSPFYPSNTTYTYVLREDYRIKWRFITGDSLGYYECYDSTMKALLNGKYGQEFLKTALEKADSLEGTNNWRVEPTFPGGYNAMLEYVVKGLKINEDDISNESKVFVSLVVEKNGDLTGIKVLRGITESIDKAIVKVFEEMPLWNPGYHNGELVKKRVQISIQL